MNFGFSDEQELLREQMRKLLDELSPLAVVRRVAETPLGYERELWKRLGELGFIGLITPEEYGGAGLGWVDLAVVLEETGRSLLPGPLLSTLLATSAIVDGGDEAQRQRWLPDLAAGSRIGALALLDSPDLMGPRGVTLRGRAEGDGFVLQGCKPFVADAGSADLFVVAFRMEDAENEVSLAVIDAQATGVKLEETPGLDPTKRLGNLLLEGVRVDSDRRLGEPGGAGPLLTRTLDRGAAAVTAELIGAAEAALGLTVQFAKDRIQFGSPIGRYQSVKHPLAEMYVDVESTKSLLYHAVWALDHSPDAAPRAVSEAKAFGSLAFSRIGIDGVQLHGAVGYTMEYDIQLYLKRSKWARAMFGDEDQHHDRIATLGGY